MNITRSNYNGVLLLCIDGSIDSVSSDELKNNLLKLLSEGEKFFILDFSRVNYISSSGLGSLVVAAKMLTIRKGFLAVCSLNDHVKKVFDIVRLDNFINVYETLQEAGNAVAQKLPKEPAAK